MSTIRVFVSYSHLDERWVKEGVHGLIPWLAQQLKRKGIEIWYDPALRKRPGDDFKKQIKSEIDRAQMAILLISQDFLNSDFIREFELPWIRERVDRGELSLIPILVGPALDRDLDWLADRQMLPGKPTPLIKYTESDSKWYDVRVDILDAIYERALEIANRRPVEPPILPAPVAPSSSTTEQARAPHQAEKEIAGVSAPIAGQSDRASGKGLAEVGQIAPKQPRAEKLIELPGKQPDEKIQVEKTRVPAAKPGEERESAGAVVPKKKPNPATVALGLLGAAAIAGMIALVVHEYGVPKTSQTRQYQEAPFTPRDVPLQESDKTAKTLPSGAAQAVRPGPEIPETPATSGGDVAGPASVKLPANNNKPEAAPAVDPFGPATRPWAAAVLGSAKAQRSLAEANFVRAEKLRENSSEVISDKEVAQCRAAVLDAGARVEIAEARTPAELAAAKLKQRRALLTVAQLTLARAEQLARTPGVISAEEIDWDRASVADADARLKIAEAGTPAEMAAAYGQLVKAQLDLARAAMARDALRARTAPGSVSAAQIDHDHAAVALAEAQVKAAQAGAGIRPLNAPPFQAADLAAALNAVSAATTVDAQSYPQWCTLAEVTTYVTEGSEAQQQALRTLAVKVASSPKSASVIDAGAARLLADENSGGIVLIGMVAGLAVKNGLCGTAIRMNGDDSPVVIMSAHPLDIKQGQKAIIFGSLIKDPVTNLPAYPGTEPIVVWAGFATALP